MSLRQSIRDLERIDRTSGVGGRDTVRRQTALLTMAHHPVANPTGQIVFRGLAGSGGSDYGDDLSILGDEVIPIESEEHNHREKRDPLVAVVEGMIPQ